MALLNPSPAYPLPPTMWVTLRAVAMLGPLSDDELLAHTSPDMLWVRRAQDGGDLASTQLPPTPNARAALRGLRDLALIRLDEGRRNVASNLLPDSYADFCSVLRMAVLAPDANAEIADLTDSGGPKDLSRGLAWLLTKDPMQSSSSWHEVQQDQDDDRRALVNKTRWPGFRVWAEALGFAENAVIGSKEVGSALTCNPTRALRDTITDGWAPGEQVSARAFLTELRQRLPVLSGGAISRAMGYPLDDDRVDAATSYAMQAGEVRGWVQLGSQSDATDPILLADLDQRGSLRPVSHVVVQEVVDV